MWRLPCTFLCEFSVSPIWFGLHPPVDTKSTKTNQIWAAIRCWALTLHQLSPPALFWKEVVQFSLGCSKPTHLENSVRSQQLLSQAVNTASLAFKLPPELFQQAFKCYIHCRTPKEIYFSPTQTCRITPTALISSLPPPHSVSPYHTKHTAPITWS